MGSRNIVIRGRVSQREELTVVNRFITAAYHSRMYQAYARNTSYELLLPAYTQRKMVVEVVDMFSQDDIHPEQDAQSSMP
jgi:hypothetical protein